MTEMAPESLPEEVGEPIPVTAHGSWEDGVFKMEFGVSNDLSVSLLYNFNGESSIPALLAIIAAQWPQVHEATLEAIEDGQAKRAEELGLTVEEYRQKIQEEQRG